MPRRQYGAVVALLMATVLSAVSCSTSRSGPRPVSSQPTGYGSRAVLQPPAHSGEGSLGPITPSEEPKLKPLAAGPELTGRALPTNTWWSSALIGKFTSALWAFPIVATGGAEGLGLSAPTPVASANSVISSAAAALTVGGPLTQVTVTSYGDFSVSLALHRAKDSLNTVIAQGSPFVPLSAPAGILPIICSASDVRDANNRPLNIGQASTGDHVRITAMGQIWFVAANADVTFKRTAAGISIASKSPNQYVFSPAPDGVGDAWASRVIRAARAPVSGTTSTLTSDGSTVTQRLEWKGSSATGVLAVLPHQRDLLSSSARSLTGSYETSRGRLTLVEGNELELKVALPGFLPGVPDIPLTEANRTALLTDLKSDIGTPDTSEAGSYFGPKALGRLASMLDIARQLKATDAQAAILNRLRSRLVDWLTYSGPRDKHWLAYDATWGGIVAHPSEFGNSDYNDHHFQYGYLIAAANSVAAADPTFVRQYGHVVDLLVADVIGADAGPNPIADAASFPPYRVFSAYEGHSLASGFAVVADGANQESSSEAVNAWAAIARWGMVTNRPSLTSAGVSRYALEADSARVYWLGEEGRQWPEGYSHDTVGIVWGGKVDFSTFFDGSTQAVIGIELLPFGFDSLYRTDAVAASRRANAVATSSTQGNVHWPDIFLMDSALIDPAAALSRLTTTLSIEPGNSRTFTRYWLLTLAELGKPRTDIRSSSPFGFAFGTGNTLNLAAANPTGAPIMVSWTDAAHRTVGSVHLAAGQSVTVTGHEPS